MCLSQLYLNILKNLHFLEYNIHRCDRDLSACDKKTVGGILIAIHLIKFLTLDWLIDSKHMQPLRELFFLSLPIVFYTYQIEEGVHTVTP